MRCIGKTFRRPPTGRLRDRNGGLQRQWASSRMLCDAPHRRSARLVDKIQHTDPIRSHSPVSRQESARGRCLSIVKGVRRPERPGYGTRRAATQARRTRCAALVMRQHHRAPRAFPDELGKPSYGVRMLDSIHQPKTLGGRLYRSLLLLLGMSGRKPRHTIY